MVRTARFFFLSSLPASEPAAPLETHGIDCAPQKFHPHWQDDGNAAFNFFGFFPA